MFVESSYNIALDLSHLHLLHLFILDANGKYTMWKMPKEADWFLQSLCSAHLEQKHQWGEGIGLEDNMFITNEEWANFALDQEFVGQSAHALDLESKTLYAVGAFTSKKIMISLPVTCLCAAY